MIYAVPGGLLGLRPVARDGDRFDEDRTGLDHLSFSVDSAALQIGVSVLDRLGIAHGGIKDVGTGKLLEFRDPDGIALELFASNG